MPRKAKRPSYKQRKTRKAFTDQWASKFTGKAQTGRFTESWQRHVQSDPRKRHTYYVTVEAISDGSGTPPFAEPGEEVTITLAIMKKRRNKELTGLTYDELAKDFDRLVDDALNRNNVTLKSDTKDSITAIFRHRSK